ncbi:MULTISPECIES: NUDIX domain-containing protein [unclassified Streptomyces]|uniref:NUDIX domain-containing protein n=1 Tax=unclassified Streptomyces TaxID=2593676 RepID=UPI002547D4D4|nr:MULTISPECIES: NUDIX hydrolase [unclassified Streptomyces]
MTRNKIGQRALEAAMADASLTVVELDDASRWLAAAGPELAGPLAAEVWVFDETLSRVVLVKHRWRGLVPPGGRVEPGETPREAAGRELLEETGLRVELLREPALATVRSYRPGAPVTFGLSYAAVVDVEVPLVPEDGQPVTWVSLEEEWDSWFPGDPAWMHRHAAWLASQPLRSYGP